MPHQTGVWAEAHAEIFTELEQQAVAVSPIPPQLEIDSIEDPDFGALYRVWLGMSLMGTFYQRLDGLYTSQPINSAQRQRWATSTEAIEAILAA